MKTGVKWIRLKQKFVTSFCDNHSKPYRVVHEPIVSKIELKVANV